jgi:hypothetical protein
MANDTSKRTWTDVQFTPGCCRRRARASLEALRNEREDELVEPFSFQQIADGWDYCLHCATGDHYEGEYVTEPSGLLWPDRPLCCGK